MNRAVFQLHSLAIAVLTFACSRKELPVEKKARYPEVPEQALKGVVRTSLDSPNPTATQLARKSRSIAIVKTMGLPWVEQLPVIEDETQIKPRTSDEVAGRCLATAFCAFKGES